MTLMNPTAPADQLRTILADGTCGDVGMLLHLAKEVLAERDALAAGPPLEEIWLVDDQEHNDPGVWTTEAGAFERALADAEADWRIAMGAAPVAFKLRPFGNQDDPSYEVVLFSSAVGGRDSTGITVRRLNVNAAKRRPEDVFAPPRWAWGVGQRNQAGAVFISHPMSRLEARQRLENTRALLPEDADSWVLLRWRIGPVLAVREDNQALQQENPEPAVGSATDNEAHSDANQPTGSNASRPESSAT